MGENGEKDQKAETSRCKISHRDVKHSTGDTVNCYVWCQVGTRLTGTRPCKAQKCRISETNSICYVNHNLKIKKKEMYKELL